VKYREGLTDRTISDNTVYNV